MPVRKAGRGWMLLETGQTTMYSSADDGDYEIGRDKAYTVCTTGACSGTTVIEVAEYANNGISFTAATSVIADTGGGLATILATDTVVIHGSANNDGVYTVTVGGAAGQFTVAEALTDEAAGAYVTILKRTTHSNNVVFDRNTKLTWSRYTSDTERVGPASNGTLNWYDAATTFILHPLAADLQMIAPDTLRIVGSNEVARYRVGTTIECAGFANAVNNDENYRVTAVALVGADTDITLDPVNATLVSEAAGGNRSISIVCRSIFGYCASARENSLGGYDDWRVPNAIELFSLPDFGVANIPPDAVAFPGWIVGDVWVSTTSPNIAGQAFRIRFTASRQFESRSKTESAQVCALVRGGT